MESYHDQPNVALYRELQQRFPDYFAAYSGLQIITDEEQMRAFTEETGKELGVVFDNRPFYFVVCDLVENAGKKRFRWVHSSAPSSQPSATAATSYSRIYPPLS